MSKLRWDKIPPKRRHGDADIALPVLGTSSNLLPRLKPPKITAKEKKAQWRTAKPGALPWENGCRMNEQHSPDHQKTE